MVVTVPTQTKVSQPDAAEIASHKGGRIGICEACGYEWSARSTKGAKPSRCPECGSSKRAWEDQLTAEQLKEVEPLRHTTNRKKEEGGVAEITPPPTPKPTPAARETAKQTKKIADVTKIAETAEAVTEPEKISLAGLPEGAVQTIQNPAYLADNPISEPGYVAWENEAGETEYGVIVREDLLEAMQETVAAETASAIIPVGLEDVEILREAGLLDVAEIEEPENEDEHDDPEEEEEIEEEETGDEPEDEPETKKQGIPVVGALLILGGMAAIAYLTIKAPVTQKITRKEPSAAEKAMYRVSSIGKLEDTLSRISRNAA